MHWTVYKYHIWSYVFKNHVKNFTTKYIITQVTIIPPNKRYLSPSDLRSINRITVLDIPNIEDISSIFFLIFFIKFLWSLRAVKVSCPCMSNSPTPCLERCKDDWWFKAASINIEVSDASPLAASALVVNLVWSSSWRSRSACSLSYNLTWRSYKFLVWLVFHAKAKFKGYSSRSVALAGQRSGSRWKGEKVENEKNLELAYKMLRDLLKAGLSLVQFQQVLLNLSIFG